MLKLNLSLFDGGSGAGAAASGATGATAPAGANTNASAAEMQTASADDSALTGNEAFPAEAPAKPVDKGKQFDELIKNEYKDEFAKRTQKIIDQRFKETKSLQEKQSKIQPMLDVLAKKYGVQADDIDGLAKAIGDDDSLIESLAMAEGLTVEQYRFTEQLKRENEELKRAEAERKRIEADNKFYADMLEQSKQMQGIYPTFNLEAELQNKAFMEAMSVPGVSVRTAYELAHRDELIAPAMATAAQKATEAVVNNIKARGARPTENGLGNGSGLTVQTDVSKMTKAERQEIFRRVVERGERI
jgi:hypothetical protein